VIKRNDVVKLAASLALMGAISVPVAVMAQPQQDVNVKVNGVMVTFPDAKPYIDENNNRTMIPVRFVSEALETNVNWDQSTQTVLLDRRGEEFITLKVGEKKANVNGKVVTFDAAAVIKQNRTFVPLRFVSETFGAKVEWFPSERLVNITTGSQVGNTTSPANPSNGTGTGTNPTTGATPNTGNNPSAGNGGTGPFQPPIRPGQAENVEAMKRMVSTFKVENGVLKGTVSGDVKGFVSVQFKAANENVSEPITKTDWLKPNQTFELKITDQKGTITLHGQDGTAFGTVSVDYPSLKIIGGR
jgi:hypothetical protein